MATGSSDHLPPSGLMRVKNAAWKAACKRSVH